ncbi:hypothetical protein H5410_030551 [Solanum commersonii]|uniref:Integrase core domain containing protein n=1 Tax=Solanum commersonii TaxID=4109 RepID=A0A9J5YGH3_SOLCO|nr:hypothetical protein H5410_030551 [Solanum commersonii]
MNTRSKPKMYELDMKNESPPIRPSIEEAPKLEPKALPPRESVQAIGSNAKSSTGSGENDQAASSDETTSSEPIPAPPNDAPTPVAGEPNRWCVEGQWQIYRDAKMVNDK